MHLNNYFFFISNTPYTYFNPNGFIMLSPDLENNRN